MYDFSLQLPFELKTWNVSAKNCPEYSFLYLKMQIWEQLNIVSLLTEKKKKKKNI